MRFPRPKTRPTAAVLALGAALLLATSAFAIVSVYHETFNSKGAVKRMKQVSGGKKCDRKFREKSKVMGVEVLRDKTLCAYSPPVAGDSPVPDHELRVVGRILKKQTPKRLRKASYLSLLVRMGSKTSYELQILPQTGKYRLQRSPDGQGFPEGGSSNAIAGIGEKQTMRLRAFGGKVAAFVNGKRLAVVEDNNTGQVDGRKLGFGVGSRRESSAGPLGTFEKLRVYVPEP